MKEARIGSLPWFAGVYWLLIAMLFEALGYACLRVGAHRLAWRSISMTNKASRMAMQCAVEAGAEL